jgi:hypothetical protein
VDLAETECYCGASLFHCFRLLENQMSHPEFVQVEDHQKHVHLINLKRIILISQVAGGWVFRFMDGTILELSETEGQRVVNILNQD